MSRIGEDQLRAPTGRPAGRLAAPIRRALETGKEQQCHAIKKRLTMSADFNPRDAEEFPNHTHILFEGVVNRLLDVWDNDPEDTNAAVFIAFLKELQTSDPDLLNELFGFVSLCCTGSVIEGWLAGIVYADEKRVSKRNARRVRPGR